MSSHAQFTALREHMGDVFQAAAKERSKREHFALDPDEGRPNLAWIPYERQVMLDAVNQERKKLGKPEIDRKRILRVERFASGHVDYGTKFPLYCAELVLDTWRPV